MANFGDSVSALVETYTKCLHLLKAFKGGRSDARSLQPAASEVDSLRRSIRSDRARVHRAYSSRLWAKGKLLEKGDSRSKSALRRILERLKKAITNLLGFAKVEEQVLDYASLMSLSNSSRIDAIKAMDRLSSRLSSGSVVRESRRSEAPTSKQVKRAGGSQRRDSSKQSKEHSRTTSPGQITAKVPKLLVGCDLTAQTVKSKPSRGGTPTGLKRPRQNHKNPAEKVVILPQLELMRDCPSSRKISRISYVSTSSDSTKLGEIPYRRSRLANDMGLGDYSVHPVFPLHSHQPPARDGKRGLFRRIFGSRE